MLVDAIVLSGGRSSRLDFVPKAEFTIDDVTLLNRALLAAGMARRIVVVGPKPSQPLKVGILLTREDPPFSGPAAGIAVGLDALSSVDEHTPCEAVLVLACDMPRVESAMPLLVPALERAPDADGAIAVDGNGRRQPLAAVYRWQRLRDAAAAHAHDGSLIGLSMFGLLEGMSLVEVEVADHATADLDSWDDAITLGARPPASAADIA